MVPSTNDDVSIEDDSSNPIVQWSAPKFSDDIGHSLYLQRLAALLFNSVLGQQGSLELTIEA